MKCLLFAGKYNFVVFPVQPAGENNEDFCLFGINDGKKEETFFCIIFQRKICVKIIPKVEKRTTQLENMCYNIVGKKRVGELCSEVKQKNRKHLFICPNRMGQEKIYCYFIHNRRS